MSHTLSKHRILFGVPCDTASDVVEALEEARSEGEEVYLRTLVDAMAHADEDIICGHIDRFRIRLGKELMESNERSSLMSFFHTFTANNPDSSNERTWKFISEAVDEYA